MSACTHPAPALYVDVKRGTTTCTLCGDVVVDQQFELDPIFARSTRSGVGSRGGASAFRPTHTSLNAPMPNARPSIDVARREMMAIARQLEISTNLVEMALGMYKLALGVNAISGTRSAILCACLYAMCRRERTSHVIYDFAEVHGDHPHAILGHMKQICEATHTEIPVVDPSCLVQRFAEQMNLGERAADVVVCALKVLRSMKDDWIACGRRPMGVCAAALLVACYVFGIARSPEQVCGLVRLTADTITRRLNEFAATPTAALEDIDTYQPNSETLPPAFTESSRKATEEDVNAGMRELSALYYELIAEAKVSTPPTEERCSKWRRFIQAHCELEGIIPSEDSLDLSRLSAEAQLQILGLPHTTPIPFEFAEDSVKREEEKLLVKREEASLSEMDADASNTLTYGGRTVDWFQPGSTQLTNSLYPQSSHPPETLADGLRGTSSNEDVADHAAAIDFDDPQQFRQLTEQYKHLMNTNEEVLGLRHDFDSVDNPALGGDDYSNSSATQLFGSPMQMTYTGSHCRGRLPAYSPVPGVSAEESREMRAAVREMLRDRDRRHALPWEFVILQTVDKDDATDIRAYLVLDNEERLRRQKVGEALYKERWDRGRARTMEEISELEEARTAKRRRRHVITEPTSIPTALERVLRGRGAGTVNVSHIGDLIPGLIETESGEADAGEDEWD